AVAYPLGDTGDGIAAELVGEGLVPEHGLAAGVPEGLPDLGDLEEVVEGADPAADDPDPCTGEVLGAGVVDGVQLASAEFRSTGVGGHERPSPGAGGVQHGTGAQRGPSAAVRSDGVHEQGPLRAVGGRIVLDADHP